MKSPQLHRPAQAAILTIAEIKAAVLAFDRGEVNVFEALETVLAIVGVRDVADRPSVRPARGRRERAA